MKKQLFFLISLLFAVAMVQGANWYVNLSGTNDGSHGTTTGTGAFLTIGYAISAASAGDVIFVAAGTYNENLTVTKALTINGANANVAYGSPGRGAESKVQELTGNDIALFTVKSDGVTINGFELTAPGSNTAVYLGDGSGAINYSNLNIEFNYIHDLGTLPPTGNVYAIAYYVGTNGATTSNINISDNYINNIHNTTTGSNYKSAGGIWFGQSTSTCTVNTVTVMRNIISNIKTPGSYNSWGIIIGTGSTSGGGKLVNPVISYNEISGLVASLAGNAHAIGLEGNAPGASVTNNLITLTTNQYGVYISNSSGIAKHINYNSFSAKYGISSSSTVDGTNNWWSIATNPGSYNKTGNVTFTPWLTNGTDTDPATGFQPCAVVLSTSFTNACPSSSNGTASVSVTSGGTGSYSYKWSVGGQTSATATGLAAGTYTITVTDINTCSASGSVTVSINPPISATATVNPATCNDFNNGSIDLTVSGGTSPYTYLWSNNATTPSITGLVPNSYSVTVTDNIGCTATANATVEKTGPVYNVTQNSYYCTIQAAVAAALDGDVINIANGTYYLTTALYLNHELTITGESEAGVIINASGVPSGAWGIAANKSNTTLSNFTVIPNGVNGVYPIHVGENVMPAQIISHVTLNHITINGAKKTAFDFNGVDYLTLSYLTATNSSSGNGVQTSGCQHVNASHITTSGNSWGGFAVYSGNPANAYGRGSDDVTIDGTTSSFDENAKAKVYNQNEFGFTNTNITVNGFDYIIQNTVSAVGYSFYQITKTAAFAYATGLTSPQNSTVKQISTGQFWVGPGLTIQAAINASSPGDVINVYPGDYTEKADAQNGLYITTAHNGITIQGVKTDGTVIADYHDILANVKTQANSGEGVYVLGDNVTITGLKIWNDVAYNQNQTIVNVGDNFTVKYCHLADLSDFNLTTSEPWGSLYIYDPNYNPGTNVSHVQTYTVEANWFDNCSFDANSGAGLTGPVSGRKVINNTFNLGSWAGATISFTGSNTGVSWFVYSVGGAIITGNTLTNNTQFIRARGTYDNSQFDWQSYWNNNTFDKAAITLSDVNTFAPRTYSYSGISNVRRIGSVIQSEIDNIAQAGDVIKVAAGTYNEDVNINKSVLLLGAGYNSTTVSGPIGGPGSTMQVAAPTVVIDGFKITRAGNNVADWNNGALNSAGIAVQSQGNFAEIRNNKITGMRTAIDINNSNGNNIHNNIIDDNRTGFIFRNQTDNTACSFNQITNNWTVGVLFLDASSGTNSPVQSALNSTFNSNNISGNWYGQIVDRQLGGSVPAPGTTNIKNFTCNWYGTATPVRTVANSTEPGYAVQIPVEFGGTATAPGGQPDILGLAVENFNYIPYSISDGGACSGIPAGAIINLTTGDIYGAAQLTDGLAAAGNGQTLYVAPGAVNGAVFNPSSPKTVYIDGSGNPGQSIINGHSPALLVQSGNVIVQNGITFVNSTNFPTIQVTGGSLKLRDCIIHETTGGNQSCLQVTGGTVDAGVSSSDKGNNHFIVHGTGSAVDNEQAIALPAEYNDWGSATGPAIGSNPGGDGGAIIGSGAGNVDYKPWGGGPVTTISSVSICSGTGTVDIPVTVSHFSGVGVISLQLAYDNNKITSPSLVDGSLQAGIAAWGTWNINFDIPGSIIVSAFGPLPTNGVTITPDGSTLFTLRFHVLTGSSAALSFNQNSQGTFCQYGGVAPTYPPFGETLSNYINGGVTVNHPSTSAVIAGTTATCNNATTNLTVTITGGTSPYTIVYNDGTNNIPVTSYISGANISVAPTVNTTYTLVSVTDANGCAGTGNSGSAVITANHGSTAAVIAGTASTCNNAATNLTVTITGGTSLYTVVYTDGTNNFTVNNYASGDNISVAPTVNTTYTLVSVTDAHGCAGTGNSGSAGITANHGSTAAVISGTTTLCIGSGTNLKVTITGGTSLYTVVYTDGATNFTVNNYASASNIPVSPTGSTTYTLVSVTDANGCAGTGNSGSAVITVNALQTISGHFNYYNMASTPLTGSDYTVNLYRTSDDAHIGTVTSPNVTGYYEFTGLCPDNYYLIAASTHSTAGSVNTTDAAQANYWGPHPYNIEEVRFFAGDVNEDHQVTGTDALKIQRHFVYGDSFLTNWVFFDAGHTVASNTPPTVESYPHVTLAAGSGLTVNMLGMCTGDFNMSFDPSVAKSASSTLDLIYTGNRQVGSNQEFDLPVRVMNPSTVGAVSLILNFPADLVNVQDITMNGTGGQFDWVVKGDELRIGWNSQTPTDFAAAASMLTLHLKTTADFTTGKSIRFTLAANPLNELANGEFNVIGDAILGVDVIDAPTTGINNLAAGQLSLGNYPNPFNGSTTITYTLPVAGKVTLEIRDLLGVTVKTLVNEMQAAGDHALKYDASTLVSGIYTATIRLSSNSDELVKTIKIVSKR